MGEYCGAYQRETEFKAVTTWTTDKTRVLHAALQRDTFTVEQLADLTGVKKAIVQATIGRSKDLIEEVGLVKSGKPGSRPALYRLRNAARRELTLEAVELAQMFRGPQQLPPDDVARRATVALNAVESSIALRTTLAGDDANAENWQERTGEQLTLSRRLVSLVGDSISRTQLEARLEKIVSQLKDSGVAADASPRRVSTVEPDAPSGTPVTRPAVIPRTIEMYPNRRLYDTVESRYITLADIRRLVIDRIDFRVMDKKTQEDITRSILLQIIADQEHGGESLMSRDFLSQIIRCYGGEMQGMIGKWLEQSLNLFAGQQRDARERIKSGSDPESADAVNHLAQRNYQRWRSVQDEIYRTLINAARRGKPERMDEGKKVK
jgi:polyhydroxyalkanoate synthesis repressor PhaR